MERSVILKYKEDVLCKKVKDGLEKKGFNVEQLCKGYDDIGMAGLSSVYYLEGYIYVLKVSW